MAMNEKEIVDKCVARAKECEINMDLYKLSNASPPGGQDRFWMVSFVLQSDVDIATIQCLYYPSGRLELTLDG